MSDAILSKTVVTAGLAMTIMLGLSAPSKARLGDRLPSSAVALEEASLPMTDGRAAPTEPDHRRCADGYPMHHMAPCGSLTGGPSGGLH